MFQNRDTIAAQATAAGEGGVAIVRVSGADCEAVVSRVFRAKNGKPLANRVLTYGCVMENGEIADEAMAVLMRAPHSYTRENVAEIHCHGSQALVRKILMLLMAAGARMAEPGEFTYRAFMNGRIDLAAMCSAVPYPLFFAKPYCGYCASNSRMMRSRVTFANMEAAAIE